MHASNSFQISFHSYSNEFRSEHCLYACVDIWRDTCYRTELAILSNCPDIPFAIFLKEFLRSKFENIADGREF